MKITPSNSFRNCDMVFCFEVVICSEVNFYTFYSNLFSCCPLYYFLSENV